MWEYVKYSLLNVHSGRYCLHFQFVFVWQQLFKIRFLWNKLVFRVVKFTEIFLVAIRVLMDKMVSKICRI